MMEMHLRTTVFKKEFQKLKELEDSIDKLSDDDLELAFLGLCGSTLIQIQIAEYTMLGLIAHLKENLLQGDKKFKDLNPKRFLSIEPVDKEY